jgi:predicted secreted protein
MHATMISSGVISGVVIGSFYLIGVKVGENLENEL